MITFTLALTILVGFTAANSTTCSIEAFEPCIATARGTIPVGSIDTEPQLLSLCRGVQGLVTCLAGQATQCLPANHTDAHTLLRGTVKLMQVCDKPDIFAKAQVQWACNEAVKGNMEFQSCRQAIMTKYNQIWTGGPNATLNALMSGKLLNDACCILREAKQCADPWSHLCTPEAVRTRHEVEADIAEVYGCATRNASACI